MAVVVDQRDTRAEVGRRIRALREKHGKSRAVLAGLVGRSEDWLKLIEGGKRGLPLQLAVRLARQLKVRDLSEIYGDDLTAPITMVDKPEHPDIQAVGMALTNYVAEPSHPVVLDHVRMSVDAAWRTYQAGGNYRSAVGAVLPDLIRNAKAATRAVDEVARREALAVEASVYQLAQAYLSYQADAAHLIWLSAEKNMRAGLDADDPVTLALSVRFYSFLLRSVDRGDEALDMLTDATRALEPLMPDGDADVRGLYGLMLIASATTMARIGNPAAWTAWEQADRVATTLPTGYVYPRHAFGRAYVDLHKTALAVDLGDTTEALRHAESFNSALSPTQVWESTFLVNTARAYHQRRDTTALIPLLQAEKSSAEYVKFNTHARSIIADLATTGHRSVRTEATALAHRLNVFA
nr:Putative transcriptional regulator [Kibdelosporangium sp. MJ126-NF4]CTQ95568.1 Putative transcriptional regulator [Kibdelosporangium sp. MJ126-NF4]